MPQTNRIPVDQAEERGALTDATKPSRQRRDHKRIEYAGSRWAGVALLLATALFSLFFSLQGKGMTFQIGNILDRISSLFFRSSTMTFEK